MNRKNLTAAVLAGLAGVAGLAGAAQADHQPAVNLNPDGLGEVLIYPYYTTNDGNTTLVTVVNTTANAKAVKVRFMEGYNSREVLDFNLYLSKYDVWVAAIADSEAFGAAAGVPHLFTPDTSCTVPYLYGYGVEDFGGGLQEFLDFAFTGDHEDGGPTDISRTAEGYIEVIEMGEMRGTDGRKGTKYSNSSYSAALGTTDPGRMDSAMAATHVVKKDEAGDTYVEPNDCWLLEDNWTEYSGSAKGPDTWSGWWLQDALDDCTADLIDDVDPDEVGTLGSCGKQVGNNVNGPDEPSLTYNAGGLFGGAAIINVAAGTMVSYDARAVQGYAIETNGLHFYPGTIHPSLNDGNVEDAIVFLGKGQTKRLGYDRGVDAISAVFMHDEIANTYVIEEEIAAATEWVVTFPTKAWYADTLINSTAYTFYRPDEDDEVGCNSWSAGDDNPYQSLENGGLYDEVCSDGENAPAGDTGPGFDDWAPGCTLPTGPGDFVWTFCDTVKNTDTDTVAPFTTTFDGEACEPATLATWDREESPTVAGGSVRPPVVSPAPPAPPGQSEAPFELCYEVNVLRFGEGSVFGGASVTDGGLALEVGETAPAGWARITLAGDDGSSDCVACGKKPDYDEQHMDTAGMRGLPVTGFAAETYTNGNVADGVLANYGGLFNHKGSVRCDDPSLNEVCSNAVQ